MKLALATGWDIEVDRGPGWLFVRVHEPEGGLVGSGHGDLAEALWELLEQNFARRLVVELDGLSILPSYLVGQLVMLHKRITTKGGIMRLCGLSTQCQQVLRLHRLADRLFPYQNREEAVLGVRTKPR
jgi:anti-anti-sigma factor